MKTAIIETLRLVIDPELEINIIDMGLVYSIDINEEEKKIEVDMTLSSPGCPMGAAIVGSVENCLKHYYNQYKPVINLVWEPAWSYERISEEGKRLLGM
ncbi:MAG TPA: FeS assembly SUF system protein SufT [Sphingobacteriaceae bacterium]|nr:FeS assembly SUF system protein SufT [Sphingobacteriaceae bacterium]